MKHLTLGGWKVVFKEEYPEAVLKKIEEALTLEIPPSGWVRLKSSHSTRVWKFFEDSGWYVFKKFYPRGIFEPIKAVIIGSRAERAWNGGRLLQDKGFLTPDAVSFGVRLRGGFPIKSFLVMKFITSGAGMAKFLKNRPDNLPDEEWFRMKSILMKRLGETVGMLHSKGIVHGDLRPNNILIKWDEENPRLYFIDNERNAVYKKIPEKAIVKNLVQINMIHLSHLSKSLRMRFLNTYLENFPTLGAEKKTLAKKVWTITIKRMYWKEIPIKTKDKSGKILKYQLAAAIEKLLKDIDNVMNDKNLFSMIKNGSTTTVGFINGDRAGLPFNLLVKRFNFKGFLHSLARKIIGGRGSHAYKINLKLFKKGLGVPRPVGYLEDGDARTSFYISEYIDGERLAALYKKGLCEDFVLAEALAEAVSAWHLKGAVHGDLKWSNILVEKNLDGFKIFFIDLDQARLYSKPNIKGIKKDIERFLSHASRFGADGWVREKFLPLYMKHLPLEIREKLGKWKTL